MNKHLISILISIFKSYKFSIIRILLILFLLGIFESISLALLPLSLSFFVDNNAINKLPKIFINIFSDFSNERIGIIFSIVILVSFILKNYLSILNAKYSTKLTCSLKDKWRINILNNYLNSNIIEINLVPTGIIIENIINQTELAAKFIKTLIKSISYLIISLSLFLSLFITSFKITLFTSFIFISLGLITSFPIKKAAANIGRKSLKYRQLISKILNDYLIGILQVKIYGLEESLKKEILNNSRNQSNYTIKNSIISQIPNLIGSLALVLILVIVFLSSWTDSDLNITLLATFILIAQKLQIYVGNILQSYTSLKTQKASFDEVQNLLSRIKLKNKNKLKVIERISSIEFKNVCFSFTNNVPKINNLSFNFKSGDLIRIHGKSGCGKSTLINLICGLIELEKGQIKINNNPIQNINLDCYMSKLSYVSQDNFLFNDTISNNLNLTKADISQDWIIRCCKLAGAHNFIINLPNGYETLVGERGFSLSGGQIQRLCIARAFIKNGDLMIFDEATSALDKKNEEIIFKSITEFVKEGKIVIIISHQLQLSIDSSKNIFLSK